jgi:hypothetical protein
MVLAAEKSRRKEHEPSTRNHWIVETIEIVSLGRTLFMPNSCREHEPPTIYHWMVETICELGKDFHAQLL